MALIAPVLRTGADYAFAYKAEAGMLSPEIDTPAADTTLNPLLLVGYTNVPGYSNPNALRPVRAAGMRGVAKFVGGIPAPTVSLTMTLGNAATVETFLTKALPASGGGTFHCLPVIACAVQGLAGCDGLTPIQRLARYAQINRMVLNFRVGEPVTATLEIWPLYISTAGGATFPTVTPASIRTAGGEVYMYADASLSFGADDYTAHMRSFSITIDNMLTREGQRPETQGGFLARKPGSIYSTGQTVTLQTDQAAPLPAAITDGADMGAMTATMTLGASSITLGSSASYMDTEGQGETAPEAPTSHSGQIVLTDLTIDAP